MLRLRCSLSRLHRTCVKLNGGVGLVRLYGDVRLVRLGGVLGWLD